MLTTNPPPPTPTIRMIAGITEPHKSSAAPANTRILKQNITPIHTRASMGRVRLRLARFGCKHRPFYRVVATDVLKKRDGMPKEYVSRACERNGYDATIISFATLTLHCNYNDRFLWHVPPSQLGTYDPIPSKRDGYKEIRLKVDRVKYWLGHGAEPSEAVATLLWRSGLLPPPPIRPSKVQHIPKKTRKEQSSRFHSFAARLPSLARPSGTMLG